jgi:prepilin-type N-terminal cleavage/methylation domain-containing protein
MKFNREEGLTLIELLITIAVIAIVAAISIPVITNVIESSRISSAASMQAQVDAFVDRYTDSGELSYDPTTQTFTGSVDLNADGQFSADEVIETFQVDAGQFAVTAANGVYTVAGGAGSTVVAAGPQTFTTADWSPDTAFTSYGEDIRVPNSAVNVINALDAIVGTTTTITVAFEDSYSGPSSFSALITSSYVSGSSTFYNLSLVGGSEYNDGGFVSGITINN